tara:strand:+ start:18248 stop:18883 length:636 start_codon:yes stop_codon:yes gene_type:complete
MGAVKITAANGGGSTELQGPANTAANTVLKLPDSDGSAGQVLKTDGNGNLSWYTIPAGGISEFDQWAITGDVTSSTDPVTSWARQNNTAFGSNPYLGTGMSHSSGIFTFPSTGYWLVMWAGGIFVGGSDSGVGFNLCTTNDNGSNWTQFTNIDEGGSGNHGHSTDQAMLDITDVSNQKIKFLLGSVSSNSKLKGSTATHMSNAMFIRIGDT